MDRSRSILSEVMNGAKAPAAASPGMGTGNIPYAKGMMSGQFGPQPSAPSRQAPPQPAPAPAQPSAAGPPGNGGPPPPMAAPPAGSGNPFLQPDYYFEVMGSIMMALTSAAEAPDGFFY